MTRNAVASPLILYIPGLLPKPEPGTHRDALFRCLLAGLRRVDESVADEIATSERSFDVVSWTYDFYREHRDFGLDAPSVEALIEQGAPTEKDIVEASSWTRRALRWIYLLGDRLPFLIPHLATERVEIHLRDLRRYVGDRNGIGEHVREMLKLPLRAAWESNRPILLIAHSMGSVIAYDSLWQMSHESGDELQLELLLTMGSPLGQKYLQKRLKGCDRSGTERYPANIRRWKNLAAVADTTAIDPHLGNDFGAMLKLGLTEAIDDELIFTHFRLNGVLNTHAEYGYLINETAVRIVADWWRKSTVSDRQV